jgi:carboxyl-terminal processing protease
MQGGQPLRVVGTRAGGAVATAGVDCMQLKAFLWLALAMPVLAAADPQLLAARVWGLAKYHHPELVTCARDWDAALIDQWDSIDAATATGIEPALQALLDAAGDTPRRPLDTSTPEWIAQAPLGLALREQLAWLASQQPQSQCKVSARQSTSQAEFDADQAHATDAPDRATRALAAFRYWNAIEYFFPYKADIGSDWGDVLKRHLPTILDAQPGRPFSTAMRRFTAEINDSHAAMTHPYSAEAFGIGRAPFNVRRIEGRTTVVWAAADSSVAPGDVLLMVDGEDVAARLARIDRDAFGSNPAWRDMRMHQMVVFGDRSPMRFRFERLDGSVYEVELPIGDVLGTVPPSAWRRETLDACTIGVVDMALLRPDAVDTMLAALADTDALLFDVRNYPQGTLWPIVDRLFDQPTVVAHFTIPRLDRPGSFTEQPEAIGGRRPIGYRGRLLLLQNAMSISQSEYTLMGLQATGRAITFGSQTAAADGNITRIHTPGAQTHVFTGLGVYYPDGRATQRIGIVPDVHVVPTRDGIAAGRDEVLDAALDCRWIERRPAKRLPAQGLYFAPARDGEGIDVQRDAGGSVAVFSYAYDDDGKPEWLLSAGIADEALQRFTRRDADGDIETLAGFELDAHAGPYHPVCAIADQSRLHPRGRWTWPRDDGSHGEACVEPLLSGNAAASGAWFGGAAEDGWGISVHHDAQVLAVVVYAYDSAGHPRWLMGSAAWNGSGPVELALTRVQGFCRSCASAPLQRFDAGTMTVSFDGIGSGDPGDNWLTIDAHFGDGAPWQRSRMPLLRLTNSVDH